MSLAPGPWKQQGTDSWCPLLEWPLETLAHPWASVGPRTKWGLGDLGVTHGGPSSAQTHCGLGQAPSLFGPPSREANFPERSLTAGLSWAPGGAL